MFTKQIDSMESALLAAVDNEDDHALFIASYLHGHFDVVVSQELTESTPSIVGLSQKMKQSLQSAFVNHELNEGDQSDVFSLWDRLITSAKSAT